MPPTADPYVRQELVETLYHVLWELVHVFFEHRGLLSGRDARRVHDAGASSFLYPFLGEQETQLEPVIDDVRRSVLMKSDGDRRAARPDADREPRGARSRRRGAARLRSRPAGSCSPSATAARPPTRWTSSPTSRRRRRRARAPGDRPHRGLGDPDRDRQRHRHRGDLRASGDRVRAGGRRAARAVDLGRLGERDRCAGGGAAARSRDDRDGRLRRRPDRRRAARRPRRRDALRAHPAHPGGAGERLPRAPGAGRGERGLSRPGPATGTGPGDRHRPGRRLPPVRVPAGQRARARRDTSSTTRTGC